MHMCCHAYVLTCICVVMHMCCHACMCCYAYVLPCICVNCHAYVLSCICVAMHMCKLSCICVVMHMCCHAYVFPANSSVPKLKRSSADFRMLFQTSEELFQFASIFFGTTLARETLKRLCSNVQHLIWFD